MTNRDKNVKREAENARLAAFRAWAQRDSAALRAAVERHQDAERAGFRGGRLSYEPNTTEERDAAASKYARDEWAAWTEAR